MLDPQLAFSLTGPLVMAGWAGLLLSLFVKAVRPIAWPAAQYAVPMILAVAYVLLIWTGFKEAQGGGYGSIGEIRALFASDSALGAGWFHYLAFNPLAELIARQRPLALYGLALLMLALVGTVLQTVDPRVLASGVNVWVKP